MAADFPGIEAMDFDNDLGDGQPEGWEIMKWLSNLCLERDTDIFWPERIEIHTQNCNRAPWMRDFMRNFREAWLAPRFGPRWN